MLVLPPHPYYAKPPNAYAGAHCTVTVERPAGDGYPVFVYFHGGGLETGSREEGDDFAARMLAEGFGIVRAHYRLHPQARCPEYLEDAAHAVAWTLENIHRFGGDPTKVFVTGHSAGGYLAAMVGLAEQFLVQTGHRPRELLGCVPSSGQMLTHFTIRKEGGIPVAQPVIDAYAPLHYAHDAPMPLLLVVGAGDMAARVEENALLHAVRLANGHDSQLLVVPGRDHHTIHHGWRDADDPVALATLAFARRRLASVTPRR